MVEARVRYGLATARAKPNNTKRPGRNGCVQWVVPSPIVNLTHARMHGSRPAHARCVRFGILLRVAACMREAFKSHIFSTISYRLLILTFATYLKFRLKKRGYSCLRLVNCGSAQHRLDSKEEYTQHWLDKNEGTHYSRSRNNRASQQLQKNMKNL